MTADIRTKLDNLPPFLRTAEVARLLRKSANAVVQDRYLGLGPPYIRDGRRILYDRDQVIEYLRERTVRPGDDPQPASRD